MNSRRRLHSVPVAFLQVALYGSGCATIAGGTKDPRVQVTSEPSGAAVTVDGQHRGVTPAVVELSRRSDHQIMLTNAGCEPVAVSVERKFNPWVLGNIVVGGLPGVIVDVATDSTQRLSDDPIHVNLKSAPMPGVTPASP